MELKFFLWNFRFSMTKLPEISVTMGHVENFRYSCRKFTNITVIILVELSNSFRKKSLAVRYGIEMREFKKVGGVIFHLATSTETPFDARLRVLVGNLVAVQCGEELWWYGPRCTLLLFFCASLERSNIVRYAIKDLRRSQISRGRRGELRRV